MSTDPSSRPRRASRRALFGLTCLTGGLLVAAAATLAGCPGSLDDPDRFLVAADGAAVTEDAPNVATDGAAGCGDVVTTIFTPRCAISGCHAASKPANGLDLASPNLFGRLVGVAAQGGPGVLIDPGGDPDASVLYEKMTPAPPFGSQMPLSGALLTDADLACVAAWIRTEAAETTNGGSDASIDGASGTSGDADSGVSSDAAPDGG